MTWSKEGGEGKAADNLYQAGQEIYPSFTEANVRGIAQRAEMCLGPSEGFPPALLRTVESGIRQAGVRDEYVQYLDAVQQTPCSLGFRYGFTNLGRYDPKKRFGISRCVPLRSCWMDSARSSGVEPTTYLCGYVSPGRGLLYKGT